MAAFMEGAFQEKMNRDLNVSVEIIWIPWDRYWEKKELIIIAGEHLDWYWDGGPGFSRILSNRGAIPLDDLLDRFGKDIYRVIPRENFIPYQRNGFQYAIPSQVAPTSEKFRSVLVRTDLLQDSIISNIDGVEDLENLYWEVLKTSPDTKIFATIPMAAVMRSLGYAHLISTGIEGVLLFDEETGKVSNKFTSPAWLEVLGYVAKWHRLGWLGDELTMKPKEGLGRIDSGNYLMGTGGISRPMERIDSLRSNIPTATLLEFLPREDLPKYKWLSSSEILCVSPTAKYPEQTMQVINWFYKSEENYMFAVYGIEGKDYRVKGERITKITGDSFWYEWIFRNKEYMKFPVGITDQYIQAYREWDKDAIISDLYGFVFDASGFSNEEKQLVRVINELARPIETGYLDFESGYPRLLEALEMAGLPDYLSEYQRQLDRFLKQR